MARKNRAGRRDLAWEVLRRGLPATRFCEEDVSVTDGSLDEEERRTEKMSGRFARLPRVRRCAQNGQRRMVAAGIGEVRW